METFGEEGVVENRQLLGFEAVGHSATEHRLHVIGEPADLSVAAGGSLGGGCRTLSAFRFWSVRLGGGQLDRRC